MKAVVMTCGTGASGPRWAFINYPADMGARAKRWVAHRGEKLVVTNGDQVKECG